jgi:cytochrome bd-type quinol oxidase subunit 1
VHTVTGALLLAATLITTLVSYRMLRPGHALVNSSSTPELLAR